MSLALNNSIRVNNRRPRRWHRVLSCFVLAWSITIGSSVVAQEASPAAAGEADATDNSEQLKTEQLKTEQLKTEQLKKDRPKVAENIGVDSKTGKTIPLDLKFRDTEQRLVEIGTYFDGKRPVMLSFNYSNCPKLCSVQLENMTKTLKEVAKRFKVEEDFQIVSISIDPTEPVVRSRETKDKYVQLYDQQGTEEGWHFLTGERENIQKITDACGFRYRYIARQKYYSHPPVFILVSPEGEIVRYIHGLDYESDTIEQALIEAAEGKIGSPINIFAYGIGCFVFDEATGKYTFQAMAIMRAGAVATVVILLVTLVPYWLLRKGGDKKDSIPKPAIDPST